MSFKLFFFHSSISLWLPDSKTSGTDRFLNVSGLVYTGKSYLLSLNVSYFNESGFPNTPGILLIKASSKYIAGTSPPEMTVCPIETS